MRALSTIIVLALFISAGQGEAHDSCASFVLPPWATTGDFVAAAPEVQEKLRQAAEQQYLAQMNGQAKYNDQNLRPFTTQHISYDLHQLAALPHDLALDFYRNGLNFMAHTTQIVMASGAASRAGEIIKGITPYNLFSLLRSPKDRAILDIYAAVAASKDPRQVVELYQQAQIQPLDTANMQDRDYAALAQKFTLQLQEVALPILQGDSLIYHPQAINAVDEHLILQAVYSALIAQQTATADYFGQLYFWTGPKTHAPIQRYLNWLRQNYEQKEFHENAEVDAFIKACLKRYFALAAQKNHTFLFGHHEYVYPLIAQDGHLQYSAGDPAAALGIGSGAIFDYLDHTSLGEELINSGRTHLMINNIEVALQLPVIIEGLHLAMAADNANISVLLTRGNYEGGNPFIYLDEQQQAHGIMVEQSSIDPQAQVLKQGPSGDHFFNTNTALFTWNKQQKIAREVAPGIERKKLGGKIVLKVKANLLDATRDQANHTSWVLGRHSFARPPHIVDYLHVKTLHDFQTLGNMQIANVQHFLQEAYDIWRQDPR